MANQSESPSGSPGLLPQCPVCARILVAEDPFVGSFLKTILQRRGHQVVTCEAHRASELMEQGNIAADVVITNTPEAFVGFAGTVHLLYIAATPDPGAISQFPACRVLRKPFRNDDLLEAVEELTHTVVP
jgi:hypothetical protein